MSAAAPSRGQKQLKVIITADVTNFVKGLSSAQHKLEQTSRSMIAIGQNLAFSLGLPLAAVSTAALKMANDFEKATNRLVTQTNVSRGQVAGLTDAVKELADSLGVDEIEAMAGAYAIGGI